MNNTIRHYIGGTGRDGKQDWLPRIARDDQATGIRDHKRDRRVAKVFLKPGDGDDMPSGKLDFTQNPGKVMDDITFVRSHWWLVSEGFSLSTANSDVQKLPATLYHRIADSLAYAA